MVKYFLIFTILFSFSTFGNEKSIEKSGAVEKTEKKELTIKEIVDKVDKLYRSETSYSKMEMKIVTEHWKRTMKMKVWSKGMDETFIRILSPRKDRGISTLRKGNKMWNYFPKINKVMKIPPSMMMGSWMGSDFTNDDLVKESSLLKDYSSKLLKTDNNKIYKIELIPKKQTATVWGKIVITIEKERVLPISQEYYDEKGKKMRVINFKDVKTVGGKTIPTVMELIPLNKKGNKTVITYKDSEFNIPLKKSIFSLRNLQKRR